MKSFKILVVITTVRVISSMNEMGGNCSTHEGDTHIYDFSL
jgi:hypothetical protein